MNEFTSPLDPDLPEDEPPWVLPARRPPDDDAPLVLPARGRRIGWGVLTATLAWLVVVGIVGINLFGVRRSALTAETAAEDQADVILDVQARYMVGAGQMQGGTNKAMLLQQLPALEAGRPERRLRVAVLAGELGGPAAALQRLRPEPNAEPGGTDDILFRLYRDYNDGLWDAPTVTPAERDNLRHNLGWYGDLALAPNEGPDQNARQTALAPAWRTLIVVFAGFAGAFGLAAVGLLGLLVLGVFWWLGSIRGAISAGAGRVAIWAETFGLYLIVFVGLSFAASFVKAPLLRMALMGAASLMSLVVLAWPRLRGISWAEIYRDIGWTRGRGWLREAGVGLATYVMALPILGVGVVAMLLLMRLARALPGQDAPGATPSPEHPIVPILVSGGWGMKLLILLLIAVIAPIVEETMFRGVLYRHLREATGRLGGVWSFLASTSVVSFVFAAIHPQGWLAIPALMGLAFAFNLAREWRGTLIPSMIAHGLNNGLVMSLLLLALG